MEGLCIGALPPPWHPLSISILLVDGEEMEGGKLQFARAIRLFITSGPGHPRGALGPGAQC